MTNLAVVVPAYNEQDNIKPFIERTIPVLEKIGSYELIFSVDPCSDNTENLIREEIKNNRNIKMIVFSRRFGQPSATIAGILNCKADSCVVIDVDLQDPPELIAELHQKLIEGYDVVYAKRKTRKGETIPKLIISYIGYKIIHRISDVKIPPNTGDFRIISRRVIEELRNLNEGHGFLRGLVSYIGFKQTFIEYDRDKRHIGRGNYNRFLGSLKIGFNGIVGFSNFLLFLSLAVGTTVTFFSFLFIIYMIIARYVFNIPYPLGIPTIICTVLFIGGVQLVSIGILGEYIGRIYDEVKRRPPYIIDKIVSYENLK